MDTAGKDIDVSLTHLQASRFPLLRRLDQQFRVETQFSDYQKEISRVNSKNKVALSSLGHQERRLREMQALLRSSLSIQPEHTTQTVRMESADAKAIATPNCNRDGVTNIDRLRQSHVTTTALNKEQDQTMSTAGHTSSSTTNKTSRVACIPEAPRNVLVTNVRHDSFAVQWDVVDHDTTIVDFEVQYYYSAGKTETQVLQKCSRWCLSDQVPQGQFVVENLEPNTEYRDISIRCRNHVGWSLFSDPVTRLTTAAKHNGYENRRRKFLYRIGYIEQSIESLEAARQAIPAQQMLLARTMSKAQARVLELNAEIARVVAHAEGEQLSSNLLHGARQVFSQAVLRHKLETELVLHNEQIAQGRAEIIDLDVDSSELLARREKQEDQLRERKAALVRFDRQCAIVSGMKTFVSKRPSDLKRYYILHWRSRIVDRRDANKTLTSLAGACRRRIYAGAWRRLSSLVSSKNRHQEPDGIGSVLLNKAENCMHDNLAGVSHLIKNIQENQEGEMSVIETRPSNRLCEEDSGSMAKGGFLFKAGHCESALKSFQLVLSRMEARDYFSGLTPTDAAALHAEVNGKVGHCYLKLGSFDLAIVYFGRQLLLAAEEDVDVPRMGSQRTKALMGLGMCYHKKYDHAYAVSFFKRALELCASREDKMGKIAVYNELQVCYACQNRPAEAAVFAKKIEESDETSWHRKAGGEAVSRKGVEDALQELDSMRCRLTDVTAKRAQVVKMASVSAHFVQLLRAKSNKEYELQEASERLSASKQSMKELQELLDQISHEIYEAKKTKKKFVVSRLIQGHNQKIKAAELLFRLQEELRVVKQKLEDCLTEIPQTEMLVHNLSDDVVLLKEEIVLETCPLMQRVHAGREYRCVSLNSMNLAYDDVTGTSERGISRVALSEEETCYIHCLETGKMKNAFVGDGEGSTAIITSLFFYGNFVYTGTMDATLAQLDISTSEKRFSVKGCHGAAVTCIYADDSKVVSGSADKSIVVWSVEGMMIRRVLGHDRGVHCIQCGVSWCISASYGTVFVWDILTKETNKISGFNCRARLLSEANVTSLQYGELEVITGDSLGNLSVWWIETSELLRTFKVHNGPITCLQADAVQAISSGLDMVVHISDITRGEVLQTLCGHTAPILGVAFDRKQIVSVSSVGELRYWAWESPSNHTRSNKINREQKFEEE